MFRTISTVTGSGSLTACVPPSVREPRALPDVDEPRVVAVNLAGDWHRHVVNRTDDVARIDRPRVRIRGNRTAVPEAGVTDDRRDPVQTLLEQLRQDRLPQR